MVLLLDGQESVSCLSFDRLQSFGEWNAVAEGNLDLTFLHLHSITVHKKCRALNSLYEPVSQSYALKAKLPYDIYCLWVFTRCSAVMSAGYAGSSRNNVETQLQEDWNNREFINVFSVNVKKIADFLTSFELSCRHKFALMNEKLNALEKKIDFLEASVVRSTQLAGKTFTESVKPIVSRTPEEARRRVLAVYKQWIKFIPTLNYLYRLHMPEAKLQDAIKAQFMQNAHVKDIRVIDMLVHKAEQELFSAQEAWTPGNVLLNVLFGEYKQKKPTDFMSRFFAGRN